MGESRAAIAAYDRAIVLKPQDAGSYLNRGNAWAALRGHDKAIADYRRVIALQPGHVVAHTNLAKALLEIGEFKEALAGSRYGPAKRSGLW